MNYIKQLEQTVAENTEASAARAERVQEFKTHLLSDKFNFVQSDGSRGDLIATSDVLRWMLYIELGVNV